MPGEVQVSWTSTPEMMYELNQNQNRQTRNNRNCSCSEGQKNKIDFIKIKFYPKISEFLN